MESTTLAKKTAKKTAVKKTQAAAKGAIKTARGSKKNANLLKLYSEMNKLVVDAVDRIIIKKFKTLVDTGEYEITKQSLLAIKALVDTGEYDVTKQDLLAILKEPDTQKADNTKSSAMSYEEGLPTYIRHYLFMHKRKANKNKKDDV